jgi:hypothetical protein
MNIKQLLSYTNQFVSLIKNSAPRKPTNPYTLPWDQGRPVKVDPTDPDIEHTVHPTGEEFIKKKQPHLFENPFQEQVDLDVDQINPADIHPNDPTGQRYYDESIWYDPDDEQSDAEAERGILTDPEARKKRLLERAAPWKHKELSYTDTDDDDQTKYRTPFGNIE